MKRSIVTEALSIANINEAASKFEISLPVVHKRLISEYFRWQVFRSKDRRRAAKTRGEIAFSGRKIRPQKGQGRSRLGERSSPMLRKGGVAHGPKATKVILKMNKKARFQAKFSCLNAVKDRLNWIEEFDLKSLSVKSFKPYVKDVKTLLIVNERVDPRAWLNLKNLNVLPVKAINVKDLLSSKKIIIDKLSLERLKESWSNYENLHEQTRE